MTDLPLIKGFLKITGYKCLSLFHSNRPVASLPLHRAAFMSQQSRLSLRQRLEAFGEALLFENINLPSGWMGWVMLQ
jgi:hypothetical protein